MNDFDNFQEQLAEENCMPNEGMRVYVDGYACIPEHGMDNRNCDSRCPCWCRRRRYIRKRFRGEVVLY
ncbi:hypothetical protein JYG23_04810 [Sedimentibacter sp. zth1]|uniref:hypothetical protein n=1 Tax=Sedimentibacter sp. zth1 TaxID=2816908 RepID=UPI001A9309BD|nr:hypothetical protein [Sedimentibacter sp. zth1]QSX06771.1 hypothetical protein JYG23_04810 [Sedimentibacter sp. zth1]